MGLVAMRMVSPVCGWNSMPQMIPMQASTAAAPITRFAFFARMLRFCSRFSAKPSRKSITRASAAISRLPAMVMAALLVVMPR